MDPATLEQVAQLERIIQYQWAALAFSFVVISILAVLLFRSASPSLLKEIFEKFGTPVLAEVSNAAVEKFEAEVKLTETELDDLAASVARHLRDKLFNQAPTVVNVTTPPAEAPKE